MIRRNVLIFHTAALGDFVLTWPLALALGRVFAQSRIIYVTHGQKGRLAERVLRVESADVEGGWHALYAENPRLPEPSTRMLAGAQWVFQFAQTPSELFERNVAALAPGARVVTLQGRPDETWGRHATEFLLHQLAPLPVVPEAVRQMLRSIADRGLGAHPVNDGPIVLHPGSGSAAKNWPVERFIELARRLKAVGHAVRFTLGEVECERWSDHDRAALADIGELVAPGTFVDLMEVLRGARAVVVNDSGPGHLAGILGVSTLSLFGPTDPKVWAPLGPHVRTVRHQPLSDLPADVVYDGLNDLLRG